MRHICEVKEVDLNFMSVALFCFYTGQVLRLPANTLGFVFVFSPSTKKMPSQRWTQSPPHPEELDWDRVLPWGGVHPCLHSHHWVQRCGRIVKAVTARLLRQTWEHFETETDLTLPYLTELPTTKGTKLNLKEQTKGILNFVTPERLFLLASGSC